MISEKEKDVLAAWMIMRRGAEIIPIHIRNDEKKLTLSQKNVKKLNKFAYGSRIKPISIKSKVEINKIIKEKNVKALVFGSTKFHARKENLPVFEPLIGLDKKQLKVLEKIVL
jgi:adenylyl- and sulfurtransferase ThiI